MSRSRVTEAFDQHDRCDQGLQLVRIELRHRRPKPFLLGDPALSPRLDACCVCGAACPMGQRWISYSAQTGGVLCEECRKTHFGSVKLTPATLRSLDGLFADDRAEAARSPLEPAERGPVWRILLTHVQILLGKTPKTAALLRW